MKTPPKDWKILEWDEKTNKQIITWNIIITYSYLHETVTVFHLFTVKSEPFRSTHTASLFVFHYGVSRFCWILGSFSFFSCHCSAGFWGWAEVALVLNFFLFSLVAYSSLKNYYWLCKGNTRKRRTHASRTTHNLRSNSAALGINTDLKLSHENR